MTAYACRIPEVLRVRQFPKITEEWLAFVADCHRGTQHAYDIVLGPMVDDDLWGHMVNFLDGSISREALLALAKDKKPVHQISFRSARALTCLTQVFRHASNGGMDDPTFLDGLSPTSFKTATTE